MAIKDLYKAWLEENLSSEGEHRHGYDGARSPSDTMGKPPEGNDEKHYESVEADDELLEAEPYRSNETLNQRMGGRMLTPNQRKADIKHREDKSEVLNFLHRTSQNHGDKDTDGYKHHDWLKRQAKNDFKMGKKLSVLDFLTTTKQHPDSGGAAHHKWLIAQAKKEK